MARKDDTFDMESSPPPPGGGSRIGVIAAVLAALTLGGFLIFNGTGKKPVEVQQETKQAEPAATPPATGPTTSQPEAQAKATPALESTNGQGNAPSAPKAGTTAAPTAPAASSADATAPKETPAAKDSPAIKMAAVVKDAPVVKEAAAQKSLLKKTAAKKSETSAPQTGGAAPAAASGEGAEAEKGVITFDFNKAEIRPMDREKLQALIQSLKGSGRLIIVGHADNRGPETVNYRMSRDRAVTVAAYLHSLGLKNKLSVKGVGSKNPLADNATEDGRAKNRRVEISGIN